VGWLHDAWSIKRGCGGDVLAVDTGLCIEMGMFRLTSGDDIGDGQRVPGDTVRGFRQSAKRDQPVDRSDGRGDEERKFRTGQRGEATNDGTGDKADAERGAEEAHETSAVTRRSEIADCGLGN
jgi:hypothetical protein